jgi:PAS domain S-box-containing protein
MTLRTKLLLAQAPLALAIALLVGVAGSTIGGLATKTDLVLRDNFRSVLAAQRMQEAVERVDSGVAAWILGRRDTAQKQIAENRARFESELTVEEGNITEPGEADAARRLRAAWRGYVDKLGEIQARPDGELAPAYFDALAPAFHAVKEGADEILAINQDAMVRKNDQAMQSASGARIVILVVGGLALLAALVASMALTTRLLRPLSVLSQAVRRVGEGDLVVRAKLAGRDEIAKLAQDFNAMAGHLEQYRKSSLGELLMAQSASQAVIDSLPDPVVVVGLKGQLLNVNRAAEDIVGLSVESGRGVNAADPAVREVIERLTARVLGGHGPYVPRGLDEAIRLKTSGGEIRLLPRATPVYSEEGVIDGTTVVLQEVTRLVRFDELKTNLVATVAHEFRTPLTSLRMAIHMCLEGAVGELSDKQADLLSVAREDCERLQSIVDELLDMSRIQSGRIDISLRRVAAETLVHQAVDNHQAAAKLAALGLRSEMLPGLGGVAADADRVQLVFDNLIANALRHTRDGEIVVRALPADDFVRFEVSDTGEGIPPEHQPLIFDKFYRVPGAPEGGAGLGLYIAKEIVEAHGGQIGFTSELGKGTTFWFTLRTAEESNGPKGA